MPEQALLLLRRLLRVFKTFFDRLFLFKVGLRIYIIGKTHALITDDVIGCSDFDKQISRVLIWVAIGVVFDACASKSFLEIRRRDATSWNLQQLVVVLWFLYEQKILGLAEYVIGSLTC